MKEMGFIRVRVNNTHEDGVELPEKEESRKDSATPNDFQCSQLRRLLGNKHTLPFSHLSPSEGNKESYFHTDENLKFSG